MKWFEFNDARLEKLEREVLELQRKDRERDSRDAQLKALWNVANKEMIPIQTWYDIFTGYVNGDIPEKYLKWIEEDIDAKRQKKALDDNNNSGSKEADQKDRTGNNPPA